MAWILAWIIVAMVVLYPVVAYFFYGLGGRNEARRQVRDIAKLNRLREESWPHARPRGWQP